MKLRRCLLWLGLLVVALSSQLAIASGWCTQYGSAPTYEQAAQYCFSQQETIVPPYKKLTQSCSIRGLGPWGGPGGVSGDWNDHYVSVPYGTLFGYDQWYYCTATKGDPAANVGPPPCPACVGDPINAGTGNLYLKENDYTGFGLTFDRYYNSDVATPTTSIGLNWRQTYSRNVVFSAADNPNLATLIHEDGRSVPFTLTGGVWTPLPNIHDTLTEQTAGGNPIGWTHVRADTMSTEQYDSSGNLLSITTSDGFTTTLTYSTSSTPSSIAPAPGLLITVTSPSNRSLQLTYDTMSNVSTMTDPAGQVYQYGYDPTYIGTLVSVTYPGITTPLTYTYNESAHTGGVDLSFAMTGVTDENGARLRTIDFNSLGQATAMHQGASADTHTLTYNSDGSVAIAGPLDLPGQSTTHSFTTVNGIVLAAGLGNSSLGFMDGAARTYNAYNDETSVADFSGTLTCYGYNAPLGLETSHVDGVTSTSGGCTSTPTGLRTVQTDWNTTLRKPTERRTYDATGTNLIAKTDWTYNTRGQMLTQTQTDPATSAKRTSTNTYCEVANVTAGTCPIVGLLTSVDGPRTDVSDVTSYTYYQTDDSTCATAPTTCPHRMGDLWKITNALSQVTTFTTYDGAGRLLSTTDANGVVTDRSYSPRGWLTQVAVRGTNNNSTLDDEITNYAYDNVGQVTRVTQADASYTTYTYDTAHRLTGIADSLGDTIHYTLDAAGNRTQEDTKDPSGTLKRSVVRTFNTLGQLATTVNADGTTVNGTYTYDTNGNPNLVTDGRGTVTDDDYDVLNRLSHVTQDPGTGSHIAANIGYTHDALDRLTQVSDPQGLATTYQYDGLGNLIQLTSPDTGITTYTYDAAGNRLTQHDARGTTATYTYDALNRPTSISYPDSTLNVTYTYDTWESNCPTQDNFDIGRLTQYTDGSGSTQFCFGRFGDMSRKAQSIAAAMYIIGDTAYDAMGRPMELTEPRGTMVYYTRDGLGRINGISYQLLNQTTPTTLISNVTYYPFGPVASITYGTGSSARTLTRSYDQDYVIGSVKDPGTDGLDLNYGRDAIGNLLQIKNTAGTSGNNYTYDALNRLTAAKDLSSNPIYAYAYDATGNRTSKTVGGVAANYTYYPSTSHWLYNVQGTTGNRAYDAMGNTTDNGNGLNFVYLDTARMASVKSAGTQLMAYSYDARGERVRKTHGSTITKTVFDEKGHILGDFDGTNAIIDEMIWMDDLPVGVVNGNGSVNYVEPDHLGTPRAVIDPARNLAVWKWPIVNDPFGEYSPNGDPDADGIVYTLNLRFPGQEWDAESGLTYNYQRDYDSGVGRYFESDPIGLHGGESTYQYALARPIGLLDRSGLIVILSCHMAAAPFGRFTNPDSYHCGIYMDPDNRRCCRGENWPMTVSGQPLDGKLITKYNYPGDSINNAQYSKTVPTPAGMSDCQFIKKILAVSARYTDDLPYSFPNFSALPGIPDGGMDAGRYNSNSYAAGVLQAAGAGSFSIDPQGAFQTPGFQNPIPIH